MSTFFRALQKAGLIEMEENTPVGDPHSQAVADDTFFDTDQTLDITSADEVTPEPFSPSPEITPTSGASKGAPKSRGERVPPTEFADIYQSAALGPTPFSAEKMLKVLDGLQALEPTARKAAVLALDAAEDSWSINDVLEDAEAKVTVLTNAKLNVEATAREILELTRQEIAEQDKKLQSTTDSIKQQIADLESLLHREIARVAEQKASLEADAQIAKEDCQLELERYQTEIRRLQGLKTIFVSG